MQTQRLHHKPICEKESYRWLLGYRKSTAIAQRCHDTHIVMVADRESDIADIFDEAEQLQGIKADWLIRARNPNRVVLNSEGQRDSLKLKDKLLSLEPVGQIEFELPRRPGKKSRKVQQSVRLLRVKVHPPTGRRGRLRLQPFWLTAILAKEETPPKGEKPIEWLLLTNIELNGEIQFQDIIQWYTCRWQIEIFFYILKSGCRAEELQLTTEDRFLPCLAMYSIIAWRILMMTQVARTQPQIRCDVVFERQEWCTIYKTVYKRKPPSDPPTLLSIIIALAQMGGFLARKSDGFPGPKTIWLGLKELHGAMMVMDDCKKVDKGSYDQHSAV